VDPFTAIAALRAAYSGIQYCCQALGEGKVEIQRIKKAVEDAKEIAEDVSGIWATIKSLFSGAPNQKETLQTDLSRTATPQKDEYIDHIPDENEIVQQFVKHLGVFFKNHHDLVEYTEKRYQEVFASANPDQTQILELTTLQAEVDSAYLKLSETMRVRAPAQLGPIWTKFNEMNKKVSVERSKKKERDRIKKQQENSKRDEEYTNRVELGMGLFVTMLFLLELWAIWINLFIVE
jgi:hypothetical protein